MLSQVFLIYNAHSPAYSEFCPFLHGIYKRPTYWVLWPLQYMCQCLVIDVVSIFLNPRALLHWLCVSEADPGQQDPVLWWQQTDTHGLQKSCGEKGTARPLSKSEREPLKPLPGQAFIVFLGTLHQGWSSFTMHRFVSGGYLLQTKGVTKYIKEGYLQCKGRSGWNWLCSILGRSSSDFRKLKILSKHFLPQFRVREF